MGKGENVDNQHFLHFPNCFLFFPKQIQICETHLMSSSAFSLDLSKIFCGTLVKRKRIGKFMGN